MSCSPERIEVIEPPPRKTRRFRRFAALEDSPDRIEIEEDSVPVKMRRSSNAKMHVAQQVTCRAKVGEKVPHETITIEEDGDDSDSSHSSLPGLAASSSSEEDSDDDDPQMMMVSPFWFSDK